VHGRLGHRQRGDAAALPARLTILRAVRRPILALAALLVLFALPSAAQAASFTVNTTADNAGTNDCTATCSLRDALTLANAAADTDTITVPAGTYTLTGGELPLATTAGDQITINGAGTRSTVITAGGASRVFNQASTGVAATANIRDLTITGGAAPNAGVGAGDGGGIVVSSLATLNLARVAVTGNTAPDSGGGIAAFHTSSGGTVNVDSSTIANNTAGTAAGVTGTGGGVFSQTAVNLTNSTVSDNLAQGTTTAQGGGIADTGSVVSLLNSTVAGNRAAGAGTTTAGGVANASSLNATNTIVAGNTANGAPSDCLAAVTTGTLANDLSGDTSCGFSGAGGKQGVDPQLGPLADNGGPTNTRRLSATSPALDAGTATGCPATDQRGVKRPQGSTCDIGAVELGAPRVSTGAATRVHTTTAVLTGAVTNPLITVAPTSYQWGRTTAYNHVSAAGSQPPASSGVRTAFLQKLTPGVKYHYRIVSINGDGLAVGADRTFTAVKRPGAKPFLKLTGVPRGCRRSTFGLRLRSRVSGTGVKLRSVKVTLDGRKLKTTKRTGRFRVNVKAGKIKSGRHTLRVKATDTKGRVTSIKRSFSRCAPGTPAPKR
jgi:CSLREA domain-containing protein